ncbi:response regulator transcription factor [Salipiger mucosus]|uniref:response regulator transcription factor n=1 Tax=Salipiger mucosus TaxID=263378 RepID=UPI000381D001|nr:response regulator transcription factor [Salipiger mucosus]
MEQGKPGDEQTPAFILVLEDHPGLSASIVASLRSFGGWTANACPTIAALQEKVSSDGIPPLIISAQVLPDGTVEDVLDDIGVAAGGTQLLALLNADSEFDEERLRRSGVANYFVKPFNPRQMIEKVAELLGELSPFSSFRSSDVLFMDGDRNLSVRGAGGRVRLTPKEAGLLEALLENAGKIVSREFLYESLYGRKPEYEDRSADQVVASLRSKLRRNPFSRSVNIETVRGRGYRMLLIG